LDLHISGTGEARHLKISMQIDHGKYHMQNGIIPKWGVFGVRKILLKIF